MLKKIDDSISFVDFLNLHTDAAFEFAEKNSKDILEMIKLREKAMLAKCVSLESKIQKVSRVSLIAG